MKGDRCDVPETITLGRLDGEVRQMLASAGIDPRHAEVVLHMPLEREHLRNRRRYAQCIPEDLIFEFATATLALETKHRSALVAHEVGHCIAWREHGEHGEDDADEAAERVLGIPICYDQAWPGKGLQVDCRMHGGIKRVANPRPSKRGWPKQGTPPSDPRDYVRYSELAAAYRAQYVQGDQVIASSRTKKADYPRFELGTWRIDDNFRGMYGHEIDELVLVADPRVLEPGEFEWKDPTKALRQSGKLSDMERYADWMAQGHSYPPIQVVETLRGTLRITDGHRRAAAADSKGLPIKAWVSWLADHPDPPADRDMKVGLTYELATGREFPMSTPRTANPVKRRLWRAAEDDIIVGTASFSPDRRCAEAYLDNAGFGGTRLWTTDVEVDDAQILDLREDGFRKLRKLGVPHARGTTLDQVVPDIWLELRELGFIWVRHPETYPEDCEDTWTFVGSFDDEPELEEVDMDRKTNPKRRRNASKGPPFTPAEVEEIREDIGQCVASVADRRKLSAKYDEIAASDDVVPVRMKLTRRGAQQADLFGNPRRRNLHLERELRASVGKKRNLQYDGPIARARHAALRSGALTPSDSVADVGTGAYMALVGNEIFHVDTDGFVYVIAYDNDAEAKDDYDYLVTKFPKLMNPRRRNPKFPALPRGAKFAKHGDFDLATVPVETRTSYKGSQETVTYKPVKKKDADALVVYWKSGKVAGVVDSEEDASGKYTARAIFEGERLRPFGREYDSLNEALASLGTWRNPSKLTQKPKGYPNDIAEWIWDKKTTSYGTVYYETDLAQTPLGVGRFRLQQATTSARGGKIKPMRFGSAQGWDAAFIDERKDRTQYDDRTRRIVSTPLRLEYAKMAADLFMDSRNFTTDDGRIVEVFEPHNRNWNPARARQRNPRTAATARRIGAL